MLEIEKEIFEKTKKELTKICNDLQNSIEYNCIIESTEQDIIDDILKEFNIYDVNDKDYSNIFKLTILINGEILFDDFNINIKEKLKLISDNKNKHLSS